VAETSITNGAVLIHKMLKAAPKDAPCVTPRKPGSTSGVRQIICITAPAADSVMPSSRAYNRRGSRNATTSCRAMSSCHNS
jgi:hypothetical protein